MTALWFDIGRLSEPLPPWEQHGQCVLPYARLQLGLTRQGGFQAPSKAHDVDTGCQKHPYLQEMRKVKSILETGRDQMEQCLC